MGNCAYCNGEVASGEFICGSCSTPSVHEAAPSVTIAEPDKLEVNSSEPIIQVEAVMSAMENVDVFQSTNSLIPGLETELDPKKTDPGKFEIGSQTLSSEVWLDKETSRMGSDQSAPEGQSQFAPSPSSELLSNSSSAPTSPAIPSPLPVTPEVRKSTKSKKSNKKPNAPVKKKVRAREKQKTGAEKKTKKKVEKLPNVKPVANYDLFDLEDDGLNNDFKNSMIDEMENSYSSTYLTTVDQQVEVPYTRLNSLNSVAQANAALSKIPFSKRKWIDTKVHSDWNSNMGFIILLAVGGFIFLPFLASGGAGVFTIVFLLIMAIFIGNLINQKLSGSEWNKYISWVYENADAQPVEFIAESKNEPYVVVNFYIVGRKEKDDIPYRSMKLNVIKYSNSEQYWAYARGGLNPNKIYKGSLHMMDGDLPGAAVLVAGGTRFWCVLERLD